MGSEEACGTVPMDVGQVPSLQGGSEEELCNEAVSGNLIGAVKTERHGYAVLDVHSEP